MKKNALISSILTIALCVSLIAGSTFALFTSDDTINVAVNAAKVNVVAEVGEFETYSMDVLQPAGTFENGGTADYNTETGKFTLTNIAPGDRVEFPINITNNSNINIQYRVKWTVNGELMDALVATVDGVALATSTSDWALWTTQDDKNKTLEISVELPVGTTDDYQEKTAEVAFVVEAVQGNAIIEEVTTAEQLEATLMMGRTATLGADVELDAASAIAIPTGTVATIDLGSYTLTGNNTKNDGAVIVNNGTLNIVGTTGTLTNSAVNGGAVIENNGTMTISGANIVGAPIDATGYPSYAVTNYGDLTIEEGTSVSSERGAIAIKGKGTTIINGGTFTNEDIDRSLTSHVVDVADDAVEHTLIINGGTFRHLHDETSGGVVICNRTKSTVYVNGGSFSGGNYYGNDNLSDYGYGGTFSVTGGTYTARPAAKYIADGYAVTAAPDGTYLVVEEGNHAITDSQGNTIIVPEEVETTITATQGKTAQQALNEALAAGTSIYVEDAGTYDMPSLSGKEVTIAGTKDVIIDISGAYGETTGIGGSNVTFDGVTVLGSTNNYTGLAHAGTVTYNNATINAGTFLYGEKVVFNNCTFNLTTQYIWTYGADEVEFNRCVFNTEGKAILVYNEGDGGSVVTVKDCTFNASKAAYTWDHQHVAAVEINSALLPAGEKYVVNFEGTNTVNFNGTEADANGNSGFNGLWRIKNETFTAGKQSLITIDGVTMISNGLGNDATGNYYVYNADGLAALNAMMADKTAGRDTVVTLMSDIDFTGKTWTPVDSHADTAFTLSEINGNGYTISNLTINGQAMFTRFAGSGDVVIKDITFDNATVNSTAINTSILTVQSYQNVLLDNVDVKNSSITGAYKVAPLIATVYNESSSTVTATLKNCDVSNTTVKATSYDFCTAGMVAFVYEGDNDKIEFENCTVTNVKLLAKPNGYTSHAWVYVNDADTDDCFNEADGVTVTNCTFEALN